MHLLSTTTSSPRLWPKIYLAATFLAASVPAADADAALPEVDGVQASIPLAAGPLLHRSITCHMDDVKASECHIGRSAGCRKRSGSEHLQIENSQGVENPVVSLGVGYTLPGCDLPKKIAKTGRGANCY